MNHEYSAVLRIKIDSEFTSLTAQADGTQVRQSVNVGSSMKAPRRKGSGAATKG